MLHHAATTLVLLAQAAGAAGQQPVAQERIDAAVDRGVEYLLSIQEADGFWPYRGSSRAGCSALVLYALLSSGLDPGHEGVVRAIARLNTVELERTYDVSCAVLALKTHDPRQHRDWIAEYAGKLCEWQSGAWGYPGGADLSNTQFAALALRAAVLCGTDVPVKTWEELLPALEAYSRGGGYCYSRGSAPSGSMTCAGAGVLAICRTMLARAGALDAADDRRIARRLEGCLEWLEEHFGDNVPLRFQDPYAYLYYLYGLERAGALLGVTHMGDHDWYREGAAFLVDAQRPDGSWGRDDWSPRPVNTSFALLFLRRATSRPVTGKHPGPARHFATRRKDALVRISATGGDPLSAWIVGWADAAREELEWPGEKGRGPRVTRVDYLAGERVVASVEAGGGPADLERFAARLSFRRAGRNALRARVHVLAPPDGAPRTVESPALAVIIDEVAPEWELEQLADDGRNLMPAGRPRARCSTSLPLDSGPAQGAHGPESAVDGRERTCWLADPADPRPTLTLRLGTPQRIDAILLRNATTTPHVPRFLGRALEVEVTVDGRRTYRVRMPYEERRKGRLAFEEPIVAREIELRILHSVPGEGTPAVGLAEVELQGPDGRR